METINKGNKITMPKKTLYLIASFLAGFSIMTVELISARIIAPIIGNSVFTWTSVIGITLLGLSIGSWIGGKMADKDKNILSVAFVISAFLVSMIPVLSKNTDFIIKNIDSISGLNLILSLYLFFLPALSIGTIQPLILKKYADDFSKIGSKYGLLSALWSIGSVLGVFLTGFFFVSYIGSAETVYLIAVLLLLIGGILDITSSKKYIYIIIAILIIIFFFFQTNKASSSNIVYEAETDYYYVRVVDKDIYGYGQSRILFLDADSHSIDPEKSYLKYYPEMYPVFSYINKDIQDILIIGGGAYTMPKYFKNNYKNSNVSVIETDPKMEEISKKYFKLDEYDIKTIVGDAKIVLTKNQQKYDLIFGDAYNSFISVPWYLLTKEWNEQIKSRLNENGIYSINFIGTLTGGGKNFTESIINTFSKTFPNFYIFSFGYTSEQTQNIVIVGINGEKKLSDSELYEKLKKDNNLLYEQIEPSDFFINNKAQIITDNFAPLDKMLTPIIKGYFSKHLKFLEETIAR